MYGEVVSTTWLTPQLIRVVLGGGDLAEFSPSPYADSYVNILFEPAGASRQFPRRFTVRRWDAARRELTIDFAVHGDVGHAGRWAANAKPGDRLQFRGPAGAYSPHADVDRYLFVGDESAIRAIAACAEAVPTGRRVVIVAEVEDAAGELAFESPGELDVVWVHRNGSHDVTSLLADAVRALPRFEGVVSVLFTAKPRPRGPFGGRCSRNRSSISNTSRARRTGSAATTTNIGARSRRIGFARCKRKS